MFTLQSLPIWILLTVGVLGLAVLAIRLVSSIRTTSAAQRALSGRLVDGVGLLKARTAGVRYALDQRKHHPADAGLTTRDRTDTAGSIGYQR